MPALPASRHLFIRNALFSHNLKHPRKSNAALASDHPAWDELDYFEERKDNMRYGECRKQGLFIGPGVDG